MSGDQWVNLLRAIADLLGVLIWPALILILLFKFSGSIGNFLTDMREVTAKAGGVEVTAKRQEAAVALGAAIANSGEARESNLDPAEAAAVVSAAVPNARAYRRMQGARVLWVDDRPENNRYERQSLEAFGIDFSLSTSTEDALAQVSHRKFDLVISDMDRPPDQRAGYTLLDELRRRGDKTPYVIYAGSRAPKHVAEAERHGAVGCTNSPSELIEIVTAVLASAR